MSYLFILRSPLHPMEEGRARTIMENNARMHQLGVKSLASLLSCPTVFTPKKIKKEDYGSKYIPEDDIEDESDSSEGDVSCQSLSSEDNELQVIP